MLKFYLCKICDLLFFFFSFQNAFGNFSNENVFLQQFNFEEKHFLLFLQSD